MTKHLWKKRLTWAACTLAGVVFVAVESGEANAQTAYPGEIGAAVEAIEPPSAPTEAPAGATVVTRENFVRAETDRM
ncbi:MAG: hypothetical protein AB7V46_19835, partial [Thermomicrobiales bacterium]